MEYQVFRDWLLLKAPADTVGIAGVRCDCPLARCFGGDVSAFRHYCGDNKALLPQWARQFVCAADDLPETVVTAATALRILDTIGEH